MWPAALRVVVTRSLRAAGEGSRSLARKQREQVQVTSIVNPPVLGRAELSAYGQ